MKLFLTSSYPANDQFRADFFFSRLSSINWRILAIFASLPPAVPYLQSSLEFLGTFEATNFKQVFIKMSSCPLRSITTSSELFYIFEIQNSPKNTCLNFHCVRFAFTNVLSTFSNRKKRFWASSLSQIGAFSRKKNREILLIKMAHKKVNMRIRNTVSTTPMVTRTLSKHFFSDFSIVSDLRKITFVSLYYFRMATQTKKFKNRDFLL